jgi:hypothetical protein
VQSKQVLLFLNTFYAVCKSLFLIILGSLFLLLQACGIVIIAVAGWAKAGDHLTSLSILGGVIASGVFMLLIGLFGAFGAWKDLRKLLVLVSERF